MAVTAYPGPIYRIFDCFTFLELEMLFSCLSMAMQFNFQSERGARPNSVVMSNPETAEKKAATCPECGGTDIAKSVGISKMTEAGPIGLGYNTEYFVKASEPLVVDLCRTCGTVTRLYVKRADKRWVSV